MTVHESDGFFFTLSPVLCWLVLKKSLPIVGKYISLLFFKFLLLQVSTKVKLDSLRPQLETNFFHATSICLQSNPQDSCFCQVVPFFFFFQLYSFKKKNSLESIWYGYMSTIAYFITGINKTVLFLFHSFLLALQMYASCSHFNSFLLLCSSQAAQFIHSQLISICQAPFQVLGK